MNVRISAKLLLIFVAAWNLAGCKRNTAEGSEAPATKPAVSVETDAVTLMEVPRTLRLTGTLRGDRETDLAANASGRVLSTAVERGAHVKPGQVLAVLDVRALSLSAAEARANASSVRTQQEQAQAECDRYEQLKQKGAISDLEYQQKITQCRTLPLSAEAATARAALAAQNVGDGVIRSPFAGVVAERFIEVGQFLRQDSKVVTIVAVDPIRLEIAVPEAEAAKITEGAELDFSVAAHPGRRFTGKIRFISGVVRRTTRDLVIEAVVENGERLLMPGMFADVALVVGTTQLPSVPQRSLLATDDQSRLFVLADGRLEERIVALGPKVGERVSVTRGVRLEDRIVVSELSQLSNGQRAQ
jgi:membrane fusion protein, multidrug efflux system